MNIFEFFVIYLGLDNAASLLGLCTEQSYPGPWARTLGLGPPCSETVRPSSRDFSIFWPDPSWNVQ